MRVLPASEVLLSYAPAPMAWVIVIDRSHHGPRFQGSFESREAAEAVRAEMIADAPDWKDDIYVIRSGSAVLDAASNGKK